MIPVLFGFIASYSGWTGREIAKAILITIGVCAVVYIVAEALEWPIPRWLIKLVVVCVVVFFGIIAVDFLFSL